MWASDLVQKWKKNLTILHPFAEQRDMILVGFFLSPISRGNDEGRWPAKLIIEGCVCVCVVNADRLSHLS